MKMKKSTVYAALMLLCIMAAFVAVPMFAFAQDTLVVPSEPQDSVNWFGYVALAVAVVLTVWKKTWKNLTVWQTTLAGLATAFIDLIFQTVQVGGIENLKFENLIPAFLILILGMSAGKITPAPQE
ncbi:MAG: hypothetical protein ACRC3B_12995 [Bacteroidia bacterium]